MPGRTSSGNPGYVKSRQSNRDGYKFERSQRPELHDPRAFRSVGMTCPFPRLKRVASVLLHSDIVQFGWNSLVIGQDDALI